ncbi:max-interacting protein 1 [Platysternon megacephalum]|uniref:Max-interacting protein 1 n=1 Tax=Platysternon megacephalum TaxID=55544 RepID=A0A4D9END9_9SAUR|nr:max-interacting protein 1 [Platysternon megacephalum]
MVTQTVITLGAGPKEGKAASAEEGEESWRVSEPASQEVESYISPAIPSPETCRDAHFQLEDCKDRSDSQEKVSPAVSCLAQQKRLGSRREITVAMGMVQVKEK